MVGRSMKTDQLFIDDDDRYSRLRLIRWWDQDRLGRARVLVVGAGALGNEVLKNLALVGVGTIFVVDFDHVEKSNLTRSVLFRQSDCGRPKVTAARHALRDLNPDVTVVALNSNVVTDVGLGLFRDVDVVIGCLDNREARLWVNRCCWKVGTPWIDGGIQEINGVVKVFVPPSSACYECAMTENDYRLINLRYSCPLLRQEDLQAGKVPTAPTIASVIGGVQTQESLKVIHGLSVDAGSAWVYNGVTNQSYRTGFQRRDDCLSHEVYGQIIDVPLAAATGSADDLMGQLRKQLADDASDANRASAGQLMLDHDLVLSFDCDACGHSQHVMRPLPLVGQSEAVCDQCGEMVRPSMVHKIDEGSPLAARTLRELGVPAYDIVRVSLGDKLFFALLSEDRDHFLEVDDE
jgi:molybdopterin/thiamine biosynthesis adenylyltransferase